MKRLFKPKKFDWEGHKGVRRIVIGSLVGTTIEFYDFYIYATAAALVFGTVFFPKYAAGTQSLAALATFGIAFIARPFGAMLFGHFGDRVGRKSTLVASLLTMGISTAAIGLLPGYDAIGWLAPALLCVMRLGQGIGLGGEWGGAALLAVENAPPGRGAWFGMFPQLGPPAGFLLSNGLFLLLDLTLGAQKFAAWGWRIPFLLSSILVIVGLYVRLQLTETPEFARLAARAQRVKLPLSGLVLNHWRPLVLGSFAMVAAYATFYISTAFATSYVAHRHAIPHDQFLGLLCIAIFAMAATSPLAAKLADRLSCRTVLLGACALTAAAGFTTLPLLGSGDAMKTLLFLLIQLGLMGFLFAPMGLLLPSIFPVEVRYSGAATAYSLGGIIGASFAPYIAQLLLEHGGLAWVGYYLTLGALVSAAALLMLGGVDQARAAGQIAEVQP